MIKAILASAGLCPKKSYSTVQNRSR